MGSLESPDDRIQTGADEGLFETQRRQLDTGDDNVAKHTIPSAYYSYAELASIPFEEAPEIFTELTRKMELIVEAFPGIKVKFNIGTLVGYLHKMGMRAHDDGKTGLNDVIG